MVSSLFDQLSTIEIACKEYQKKRWFQKKMQNSCVKQKGKKFTEKLIFRDLDNLAKKCF
jgi:hypothetical protein